MYAEGNNPETPGEPKKPLAWGEAVRTALGVVDEVDGV